MREIHCQEITEKVAELCQDANYKLGEDVLLSLKKATETEVSPTGKEVLEQLLVNARIAYEEQVPMCQDTGLAVVFLEIGQNLRIVGGELEEAINQGVAAGYTKGYLRKSVVNHPLIRKNTNDNTPAIIHTKIVPGENLKITVAPKGGGSENMSAIKMLPPSAGRRGIINFIVETVRKAGANPCPPIVVGVGIGGNFEKAALMAKEALLRPVGTPSSDEDIAALEQEVLETVNKLGIGPQGFGGRTTALAVHINTYPCHIASLPVAVNLNCHAARHRSIVL
ncbi:MAG: fumarate hydratase [Clostridia bacterium]|jgi:fumarate hydratase subunit alpha|nr:fumarate hydratase [Clostridia bacterium]